MSKKTVNPAEFGVSFSLKQCRNFGLDGKETLGWLIKDAGFRRFRLMSYWNEHEKQPGNYAFAALDWQIMMIAKAGGVITLCLGARQPRWPENHWPQWAWEAQPIIRTEALLLFIQKIVERYKDHPAVISYQLENEALLKNFGERSEVDRARLRAEYNLIKRLDPARPIIMTTSTSWGIPIRRPHPDIIGFSFYHTLYQNGRYKKSLMYPWFHRLRKAVIRITRWRYVFIHELQLEPWGPRSVWKMSSDEQDKSMDPAAIKRNIRMAQRIKASPIDLWGAEWWYWRLEHGDREIWETIETCIK